MSDRDRQREHAFASWQALRKVCGEQHAKEMKGRAGAAAVCVCGHGCGGCSACSGLGMLRDLIRYIPTDGLPGEWREHIALWRSVV